jgi:hypothetical protein
MLGDPKRQHQGRKLILAISSLYLFSKTLRTMAYFWYNSSDRNVNLPDCEMICLLLKDFEIS